MADAAMQITEKTALLLFLSMERRLNFAIGDAFVRMKCKSCGIFGEGGDDLDIASLGEIFEI